jgi:hypothetical protein
VAQNLALAMIKPECAFATASDEDAAARGADHARLPPVRGGATLRPCGCVFGGSSIVGYEAADVLPEVSLARSSRAVKTERKL